MKFNRKIVFDGIRELWGRLSQEQVDGLEFLLTSIENDSTWESVQQVAYFLATINHETAHTYQPIKEIRERKDSPRRKNQDRYWLTGFYGRGYIQLTWESNYIKFGIRDDPDKALEPETAYRIASRGMQQGLFTGKKLSDYINDEKTDYRNARKVVNALDDAEKIAARARVLEAILKTALVGDVADKPVDVAPEPKPEPQKEPPVTTVASTPPVVEVPTPKGSITSKIAAATAALGPIFSATGLKIGGVQFSQLTLIAIIALIGVGIIVGAVLWDRDRGRQFERQKLSMANLASSDKANVVASD
jgi:putative chitinase